MNGSVFMSRYKKDAKAFGCKFNREIFERLEEYCNISGQNKTAGIAEKYR